jgi:hypothetical protein
MEFPRPAYMSIAQVLLVVLQLHRRGYLGLVSPPAPLYIMKLMGK